MSDPLTNMEIQDVLSSIRRLVSEDNRQRPDNASRPAPEHSAPAPAVDAGKLVLTEAQRVATEDGDQLDTSIAGTGVFERGEELSPVDFSRDDIRNMALSDWGQDNRPDQDEAAASLEDTIAELEAAVAGTGEEFEPDGSEVLRAGSHDAGLDDAFEGGFPVDEAAGDDDLAEPITGSQDSIVFTPHLRAVPPADIPEETSAPTAESTPPPGPEDDRASVPIPAFIHVRRAAAPPPPEPEPAGPEAEAPPAPSRIRRLTLGPADAVRDEHGIHIIRAPVADEAPEDDSASDSSAAPSQDLRTTAPDSDPWERGEAAPDGAAQPSETVALLSDRMVEAGDLPEAEDPIGQISGEAGIDMDMLRDLVAEIIREELQGALGERITRNVRLLVRREINRALETRIAE